METILEKQTGSLGDPAQEIPPPLSPRLAEIGSNVAAQLLHSRHTDGDPHAVQARAPLDKVFKLHYSMDLKKYVITNMETDRESEPNGTYLFVNRADEPDQLRLVKKLDNLGHTSMTQAEGDDGYHPLPVYYAGEIVLNQGRLVTWNNASGHYRPPEEAHNTLRPLVQQLLPPRDFSVSVPGYVLITGETFDETPDIESASPRVEPILTTALQEMSSEIIMSYLEKLLEESRVEDNFDGSLEDYIKGGSSKINHVLRSVTFDSVAISKSVCVFLTALKKQADASEFVAFRAITLESAGKAVLSSPGRRVIDLGVQSASVSLSRAKEWLRGCVQEKSDIPPDNKVVLIFDKTVPKYNMANEFLADHVVIPPATLLTVVGHEYREGVLYVHLTKSDPDVPGKTFSIFNGREIDPSPLNRLLSSINFLDPDRHIPQKPIAEIPPRPVSTLLPHLGSEKTPADMALLSFTLPMDDVDDAIVDNMQKYSVNIQGEVTPVAFDIELGHWYPLKQSSTLAVVRIASRTGKVLWKMVPQKNLSQYPALPVTRTKTISIPDFPQVPQDVTPIPKAIHYIWLGTNPLSDKLVKNIIANARNSATVDGNGYRSIVHVDVDDPAVFAQIQQSLNKKAPGLEVKNLNQDPFFTQFKDSKFGTMFNAARYGSNANFAAAADILRYQLLYHYGGMYLDTDDSIRLSIADRIFLASNNAVLLNRIVNSSGNVLNMDNIFNNSNFGSQPNNPVLKAISEESYRRWREQEPELFSTPRPAAAQDENGRPLLQQHERRYMKDYMSKISTVTGPGVFSEVLFEKLPFIKAYREHIVALRTSVERLGVTFSTELIERAGNTNYFAPSGNLNYFIPFSGLITIGSTASWQYAHYPTPVKNGGSSQFDTQVIIQFGNDSITADAAKNLADKHPHSLLFNREGEGHYHPSQKNKTVYVGGDNLRVQVVAHSQIDDTGAMTLGGKTPQAFAQEMKHFFVSKGFEPKHIVLASCSSGSLSPDSTRSFAEQFTQSFDLTNVSVTAYLHDIGINGQGRKFFLDDQGKVDTTRREKIIYHKNQDGRVTHEIVADLPTKVRWTNELLNKLATGRTVQSLDIVSRTLLTDAFHLPDGQLDQQKLLLSAHSPEKRQAWNKAIRQLLQDPVTYNEHANLSVQAALAQQQHSNQQQQQRSREFFQAGEKTQKTHPTVEINAHLIPPWYSLREGIDTGRDSDAWSLAFLNAKQAGKTQYDIFSAGLAADAVRRVRIIEESASGSEMADSYHLHSQFEQLKNSAALSVDNPTIFTRHNGQDLFGATPIAGAYLLKGKYHSVALHIHKNESAGYRYSLYDPQVGSFDLNALSTGENRPALHSLLDSYLQGKDSAGQTRAQQYGIEKTSTGYAFDAYRVNIEQARALTPLGELQTLLNNQVATRNLLSSVTFDGVTLPIKILLDMGATFEGKPTTLEHLISAEGTSLKKLSFQPQQLHDFLTKNNFNDPALEPSLRLLRKRIDGAEGDSSPLLARALLQDQQISGKTLSLLKQVSAHTRVNADGTLTVKSTLMAALQPKGLMHRVNQVTGYAGSGMSVLGYYLGYKAIASYEEALRQQGLTPEKRQALEFERNLALFSVNTNLAVDIGQYGLSRMASSMSGSAAKLGGSMATKARFIKWGGGGLSLVGVAMDLNDARRSFSQLLTETDPKVRQDLIVSGSLSVANAIVGLGVATAFFIGGTAAAGPIGLIVGGVLMLVGLGYAAARQVEEIEKHIYLTVGEKWDTGWRVFWGNHPAKAIQDKMAETQRSTYREVCDQFLIDNARQMVRKQGITPIYHYVYSSKDFDLVSREYWEFKLPPFSRIRKEYASKIREEDLDRERQALIDQFGASTTGSLEARRTGEYYYTPVFKEVDDVVDGASGTIENAVRFENRGNGRADGIVLFNLGDGKDTATGYRGKRNTFLGGKGAKNYQGNTLNDTFYLGRGGSATAGDFLGSYFDGKAGEDTLIIVATPAEISGYDVDLSTGTVRYRRHENRAEKIATITGIEHVMGHATLNDRMIGNEHNNQLNGQGGVSTLYGMGGNDVLTLEQGWADGGTEEDSYVILQNSCAKNAKIEIIDTGSASAEKNHVILKHHASQIQSITLVKKHRVWVNRRWVNRDNYTLRILLTNNGTTTQLDLEDAYQRSADGTQLQSHNRYSLTTHDGVQIDTTSWPKTLKVADKKTVGGVESWSLPVLAAQYVALLDNRKPSDRSFNLSREPNAYSLPALKATIAKINTVIGDATQRDWIRGDEDNNQLNGQGGHSKLYGMGGNDILILEQGFADGGTEEDSYIILQNASAENVKIAIIDTGSAAAENNHLILKQDAVQIQSITLMIKDKAWVNESWQHRDNYTLRILLTNDNGTTTQLDLEDAYRILADGKQLKLHNRYSLTTRDGLQIDTNIWPKTLQVVDKTINENGLHSWSLPVLAAQYVPIYDSKRSAFLASAAAEQSTIELIQKNAQGQSEITIDGQKTVLPKWMTLQLGDTAYNDTIEGDDSNNTLSSVQGNDGLKGKAGSDVYHLYHQPNISKTITIDNEDTSTKPATDLIILHSVSMDQLNTLTQHPNGDLLLRAATPDIAVGILELRLHHFMQHQRYQHALILDKVGDYYLVEKGEDDRAHIYPAYFDKKSGGFKRGTQQDNLQKQATSGDDWVTLSNAALLAENTFRALAGNDTVIDRSDLAITVYGGAGDDSLVVDKARKGNKTFYGEAGNDFLAGGAGDDFLDGGVGNDMLRGNQGHDRLEGGEGDDTYLYFLGDGNDVIMDNQGHNTLKLFGDITLDNLRTRVVGDNIHLIFPALDSRGNDDESHFITMSHHVGNRIEIAEQSYTLEALLARTSLRLEGDEGDNRLNGGIGDDVIVGGAGNDTLSGYAGRDKLSGGTGNDVLYGGSGDDELEGGEGDDQLYGEAGNNHLRGDAGNDYLFGHTGNDVLEGGKDDDWLSGGRGDDTYLYSRGDGNDTIKEMGGNDTLRFLGDITVDDIQLKRQGSHLYLLITTQEGKNAGEIQIENHFSLANHRLETLQIAGKAYDIHQLLSAVMDFHAEDTEEIPLSSLLHQGDGAYGASDLNLLTQTMGSFVDQSTRSSFSGSQAIGSFVESKQQATISGGLPASSSSLPML